MNLSERLKQYILNEYDMDMVGIASAQALSGEPEGHRPTDLLPGAQCIIVFGQRLTQGAVLAARLSLEEKRTEAQSAYSAFAHDLAPNFLILNAAADLASHLETQYQAVAMPLPFGVLQDMIWDNVPAPFFTDPLAQGMPLNIFKAAMAAGLGEFGWSNRFLTPESGPRQMLGAVLTTLSLPCDMPYDGPALCDPSRCQVCVERCPTRAIPAYGGASKTLSAGGKDCTAASLNVNACTVASMGFRREFQGRLPVPDLIMNNDPTGQELQAAFAQKPLNGLSVDHYPRYFCERCLLYCPVGQAEEGNGPS